jgi:tol-pal system protein YbgF
MRLLLCALILSASPVLAQDNLADVKAQIAALAGQFNALKAELVQSGAAASGAAGGDALQRLDAIEAEIVRLTARTEEVELRLNRVVQDGTTQLNDLQFRLCELETGCDVMALPDLTLGGAAPVAAADPQPVVTDAPPMTVAEEQDFARAQEVLGQGDFRTAADLFATFAQSYPGSPLMQQAQVLRGDALGQLGDTANAARAYLDAFSGAPTGPKAGEALLKLGQGLGALGQQADACTTLAEVGVRFPGSIDATNADVAMQGLGCPG